MARRGRKEIEAENLVLMDKLQAVRDDLDDFLGDSEDEDDNTDEGEDEDDEADEAD
jgi:hypothetical protein